MCVVVKGDGDNEPCERKLYSLLVSIYKYINSKNFNLRNTVVILLKLILTFVYFIQKFKSSLILQYITQSFSILIVIARPPQAAVFVFATYGHTYPQMVCQMYNSRRWPPHLHRIFTQFFSFINVHRDKQLNI